MTRILLADDHQILRHGLRVLLEKEGGVEIIGEAEDGRQAVSMATRLKPGIVIMDLQMPGLNGIEATRQILASTPVCRVIFLSMSSDPIVVRQAIQAGARAFVLKDGAFEELVEAIGAVKRGEQYLSPKIVGVVLTDYMKQLDGGKGSPPSILTSREHEVLQLLAEGKTSKEIAGVLGVSVKTVDTHRQNLMAKLDLHSIAELTKFAVKEGITSLDF
ncbi:MAG: response regulator transcription factor [Acidobacteriota bacterium]